MPSPTFPSYNDPQQYAAFFTKNFKGKSVPLYYPGTTTLVLGNTPGDEWLGWYASARTAYPQYTVKQLAAAFTLLWTTQSTGTVIGNIPSEAGTIVAAINQGTIKGADQFASSLPHIPGLDVAASIINFIKQPEIWIRVVEVIAGLAILYVGLKAITTPEGTKVSDHSFKQTAIKVGKVAAFK